MSSDKDNSNRRNSKLSTGPRTARGKRHSSQNALKYGFTAQSQLLPAESKKQYEELRNRIWQDRQPVGLLEELYAIELVDEIWSLGRLKRGEGEYYGTHLFREWSNDKGAVQATRGHLDQFLMDLLADDDHDLVLERVNKRKEAIRRRIKQTIAALDELQRRRTMLLSYPVETDLPNRAELVANAPEDRPSTPGRPRKPIVAPDGG